MIKKQISIPGADQDFSRGTADFLEKFFEKVIDLIPFRSTQLNIRALYGHYKAPLCFFVCAGGENK